MIGSQIASTLASEAALDTISGPMPAGSPAVSATRGRRIPSVCRTSGPSLDLHREPLRNNLDAGVSFERGERAVDGDKRAARAIARVGPRDRRQVVGQDRIGQHARAGTGVDRL